MLIGFQNHLPLTVKSFDGRNCIVEEPLRFRDWLGNEYRTKAFIKTDGGSVPKLGVIGGLVVLLAFVLSFWWPPAKWLVPLGALVGYASFYFDFYGKWWWSYILHDALYQGNVERWNHDAQAWLPYRPPQAKCDALLFQAMRTQHASKLEALDVWLALHWFGRKAFKLDRGGAK
jgi:hypothetical protein